MKLSFVVATTALLSQDALSFSMKNEKHNVESLDAGRRNLFKFVPAALVASQSTAFLGTEPAFAALPASALDDLPPDAAKSYYQYRIPLQLAADYYIFELQEKVGNLDEWGNIGQLFASNNARGGQGQPSRIERDFVNPMRIVLLSMPPDVSDEMRDAQFKFEAA
eukprot:CAMPEP_0113620774 /NCGR_PEP_ID=MMETSP0017_2-20120614/10594_1 /TAXON_ID=2856 /ORGANISM="Cylindrotheca closterium" /LENGTH=164 /DNA_ID=CAMNT_0000530461 /DNA_START=33 /DNA_END=523 /DNA_ORIENTATION=- /assembly_acc=CAM_ASM_000147